MGTRDDGRVERERQIDGTNDRLERNRAIRKKEGRKNERGDCAIYDPQKSSSKRTRFVDEEEPPRERRQRKSEILGSD